MPRAVILIMLLAMVAGECCAAGIVYVDPSAGPRRDGVSWKTAFARIGEAVGSLRTDGEVWVKHGTYCERVALKNYIRVRGGFLGFESSSDERMPGAFASVIDAGGLGPCVDVPRDASVTIDGFTCRNGRSDRGGGIRLGINARAMIFNCRIECCEAREFGGGVYFGDYARGEIAGCHILYNKAPRGGGLVVEYHSYPTIRSTLIARNEADVSGGGVYCPYHSGAYLANCTIALNQAASEGGGVYAYRGGPVTLEDCILAFNSAPAGGGIYGGGSSCQAVYSGCNLYANSGGDLGGTIKPAPVYAGNISTDPQFLCADRDLFSLACGSGCAELGAFPLGAIYDVTRLGALRFLPVGTTVRVQGKVVVCVEGETVWIEEPDASAAVAIQGLADSSPGDLLGPTVAVISTRNAHPLLTAVAPTITRRGFALPRPLGAPISALPALTGLRVRTWGRAIETEEGSLILRDGRDAVRVRGRVPRPASGELISITGIGVGTGDFVAE